MNKRVLIISILLAIPLVTFAEGEFVKCGETNPDDCGYKELIDLVQNIINFLIYKLATPIAVLIIGYAGFEMVTSGGDQKKYEAGKKILTNILIGYGIMLSAFLIIKLVFAFLFPDDYSLLG